MYAVFENDGLYEVYDNKDEAKDCAAKLREYWRNNGKKISAYIRKMTKEEIEMWGQTKENNMKKFTCCICGKEAEGYGNNPEPVQPYDSGKCCNDCNRDVVIPKRIELLMHK